MRRPILANLITIVLVFRLSLAAPSSPSPPSQDPRPRPPPTAYQPDVPYTDSNPNEQLWHPPSTTSSSLDDYELDLDVDPQPIRGPLGASILGPQNIPLELQNADALAPPTTDHGSVPNFKWPFALSHNKLEDGGWARQQNVKAMPLATEIAGVNMRLEAGAIREMHWHLDAEGSLRVSTITPQGKVWVADVSAGDLWYFPAGNPHSIQALPSPSSSYGDADDGAEFLLIFDSGNFSEDATFLLTDWLAHVPKSVLTKNFGMEGNYEAFEHIPKEELYIFESLPPAKDIHDDMVVPNDTPIPYTFEFSKVKPVKKAGGTVKIADTRNFKASKTIAAAEVEIEKGGLRELHWHPTQPEWTFIISGEARITLFASQSNAVTFNFYPGDIAYIPPSFGHYIENTGNSTLKLIEVLKTDLFEDISLTQWLALTPKNLIKAHLGLSDETISRFSKTKQTLVK